MRVLICSHPGLTHFLPMAQLGWAFRTEGDEVLVAIADCAPAAAAMSGLDVVDVAPDFDMAAVAEWVGTEHPEMAEIEAGPMLDLPSWAPGLAGVNRPLLPGMVDLADAWQPDVIIYDQPTTVALLVAERCGAIAVQQNLGAFRTEDVHDRIASILSDLTGPRQREAPEPAVTMEFFPPSMLSEPAEGWFRRWLPFAGGSVQQGLAPQSDRRRIVVSMGTTELQAFGLGSLSTVLEATAPVDADVILAIGDVDVSPLGKLPSNAWQVPWTPLASLVRHSDALIHHGGGGNVMTAIAANVPQLIAHDPANLTHHLTAKAVNDSGVGYAGSSDLVDSALIEQLLSDDGLRRATASLHQENAALSTPAVTARQIAAMIT